MNKILRGDALKVLKKLENESVDCIITSPPYFGLRDYGIKEQLGLENTPEEYVAAIVEIFEEARRVLKNGGTFWLNLGDSYAGSGKGFGDKNADRKYTSAARVRTLKKAVTPGVKPKEIIGIPWRVAFALSAAGWYLRQDIIWAKPNVMPESVKDRCTKNHEYVFLLAKSATYHFDAGAIKEKSVYTDSRLNKGRFLYNGKRQGAKGTGKAAVISVTDFRNKRSVWSITTKAFAGAHFAVFPEALVEPMILSGCPRGGVVLDPFMGSGTTAVVAKKLGRQYLGIELNPEYIKIAEERIANTPIPFDL